MALPQIPHGKLTSGQRHTGGQKKGYKARIILKLSLKNATYLLPLLKISRLTLPPGSPHALLEWSTLKLHKQQHMKNTNFVSISSRNADLHLAMGSPVQLVGSGEL